MGHLRGVSKEKDIHWVAGNLIQMTEHCKERYQKADPNRKLT